MSKLVIIGAGGHGKVVADAALCSKKFGSIAFLDMQYKVKPSQLGLPIVGDDSSILSLIDEGYLFVIAIGDNPSRAIKYDYLVSRKANFARIIHPRAIISESVTIGKGSVVLAGAIINADSYIGNNVIINTGAIIEHDCKVEDHSHLAPRSVVTGGCQIGESSLFGAGAIAIPNKQIGNEVIVGAGAVVVSDIPDGKTAIGIPAVW